MINGSLINGVYVFNSNDIKKQSNDKKECSLVYDNTTTIVNGVIDNKFLFYYAIVYMTI